MFWRVFADVVGFEKYSDRIETIVQLEWGWSAGSKQPPVDADSDVPTGKGAVQLTLRDATELRNRLNELIAAYPSPID